MPWTQEAPKWVAEQYPKMLTRKLDNAEDGVGPKGALVPVYYGARHPKAGLPVIFESKAEEDAYFLAKK